MPNNAHSQTALCARQGPNSFLTALATLYYDLFDLTQPISKFVEWIPIIIMLQFQELWKVTAKKVLFDQAQSNSEQATS